MKMEELLYEKIWNRKELDGSAPRVDVGSRIDVALKIDRGGHRLLDIGCGDGTLGYFAKEKYKEVYGVDIVEGALEIARKRGLTTIRVNLNEEKLPFDEQFFDTVTCLDVIEHIFDPRNLIKEISRVLKTEGIAIISSPNTRHLSRVLSLLVKGRFPKTSGDEEGYDGGHIHYFTYKDLEALLEQNGFEVLGKYGVFGKNFLKEFRSPGIVIKARKQQRC